MSDGEFFALFGLGCMVKGDTSTSIAIRNAWSALGVLNMAMGIIVRLME